MRRTLVLGNWKMNGSRTANAELLQDLVGRLAGFDRADLGICPPFPYIDQLVEALRGSGIACGAQNVALESAGAFTGEVAASMLADLGCVYVIVGHSERRALYGESSADVAKKFAQVQREGMIPVLCVGETLKQRQLGSTVAVVEAQVQAVIDEVGAASFARSAIAYEPVWAIGTGKTASPEQAQEVHASIRALLSAGDSAVGEGLRIIYGGSVKAANAAELFGMADIDGALVGGASLIARQFAGIALAAGD